MRIIQIALASLLMAGLACNLPIAGSENSIDRMITIDSLSVNPRESDGNSILAVSFSYTLGTVETYINCSVIEPSGNEKIVWSDQFEKSTKAIKAVKNFSIGVSKPGNYTMHCWANIGSASETTTFSIIAPAQPDSKDKVFTSGGLWFTYENGTAGWCLPGVNYKDYGGTSRLDVAAAGTLSGECHMPFGNTQIDSTLYGTLDKATGKISFHLKTVVTANYTVREGTQYEEKGTSTTIYEYEDEGNGKMLSEYQAGGDASYTLTCTTTNPKAIGCNPPSTGTVHWVINFNAP
ncbi:MAG: hypothetical protein CVU44_05990 [Chloroflexi bacterium HGW-Chloroflexi-6]|nr:MAG: hypothetical protein CVU44_05990 [Chloroflexi bacterium HGW-Chloroflexi-6]